MAVGLNRTYVALAGIAEGRKGSRCQLSTYVNQVRGGYHGRYGIDLHAGHSRYISILTGRLFHTRLLEIPARGTAGVLVNMEMAILSLIPHDPWVRNFGRHPEPTLELVKH